jgi:ATP-binding cassette, subfamily B, bacterial MsbA
MKGIDGQRVIKLFDGYAFERKRFAYVSGRLRRFDMRASTSDAAMTPITQVVTAIAVAAVIAVALSQANSGTLTVGSFAAFMAALAQIFDPIKRLTKVAARMQKMLVSAESVFTLVDQASEPETGTKTIEGRALGKVEFRNVSHRFADGQTNTLSNVSVIVEPGQTVALVGRSGSGKTTLVNMLPRFVLPSQGQVLIDGCDISSLRLRDLREQLSLVSQDVVLFDDTIAVNVGYGALHEASEQEIRDALARSKLAGFCRCVAAWPADSSGRECDPHVGWATPTTGDCACVNQERAHPHLG